MRDDTESAARSGTTTYYLLTLVSLGYNSRVHNFAYEFQDPSHKVLMINTVENAKQTLQGNRAIQTTTYFLHYISVPIQVLSVPLDFLSLQPYRTHNETKIFQK